jgi:hypothetical protein
MVRKSDALSTVFVSAITSADADSPFSTKQAVVTTPIGKTRAASEIKGQTLMFSSWNSTAECKDHPNDPSTAALLINGLA